MEISLHDIREWLRWLYRQEYISFVGPPEPARPLPLLGIPTWRIVRPAGWLAADGVVERMLSVASEGASTAPQV